MCVNRLLQDITGNDIPFDDKIIILDGDFKQVLRIIQHGLGATPVRNSIKFSPLWPIFKALKLTSMRANAENIE